MTVTGLSRSALVTQLLCSRPSRNVCSQLLVSRLSPSRCWWCARPTPSAASGCTPSSVLCAAGGPETLTYMWRPRCAPLCSTFSTCCGARRGWRCLLRPDCRSLTRMWITSSSPLPTLPAPHRVARITAAATVCGVCVAPRSTTSMASLLHSSSLASP